MGIFALLFLILVNIQIYFLYKTYKIKESQIYSSVTEKLDLYRDDSQNKYGLRNHQVHDLFVKFREGKISKTQFILEVGLLNKKSTSAYSQSVDSIFSNSKYEVANRYDLVSTKYLPTGKYLFDKPVTLFETRRKVTKPGKTEEGVWDTSAIENDTENKNTYRTTIANYYEIKNIESLVFRDLWALILCCILILAAVLWIFILTIRNLIIQQKKVEVLHTVVDNIAHEFKTPIATLKIAAKALDIDWDRNDLPLVQRQITRLENLMIQLNKDENNTSVIQNIRSSDWSDFFEDLKFLYSDIVFCFSNNTLDSLPFNKTDMETIIKNLCDNSVKYGAQKVDIELDSVYNRLHIKISDDGNGISKSEQKYVFEKFYRIQSDNIHNTKGLGLGLFLVKNLVEKYNGKIDLESEKNTGTTFTITLPYEN